MACKVSGPFGGLLLSSFGRKEMSLTQCTHPDAPFYELDLIGLSFANAYGLDMPCQTMITVGATSLALIWGARRRRGAPSARAALGPGACARHAWRRRGGADTTESGRRRMRETAGS
jgi:hypothetical protein